MSSAQEWKEAFITDSEYGVLFVWIYVIVQTIIILGTSVFALKLAPRSKADRDATNIANTIRADQEAQNGGNTIQNAATQQQYDPDQDKNLCCCVFIYLWLATMWKMRAVYSAFAVHMFDVATDLLVIFDWLTTEQDEEEQAIINTRQLAYFSIGVVLFHKVVSSLAVFLTHDRSFKRAFLQFWDLLLFEEIIILIRRIGKSYRIRKAQRKRRKAMRKARRAGNGGGNGPREMEIVTSNSPSSPHSS